METIVIDDLAESNVSMTTVIDLDEENSNDVEILEVHKPTSCEQFYDIYKENKALGQFIERCIELDDSGGMSRVMKRTLVPLYNEIDRSYKKSDQFERALTKAVRKIETDPLHKFSHVKDFCEFLKDNREKRIKKKVDFVTLSSKVKEKKVRRKHHRKKYGTKRQRVDNTGIIINLVEEEFEVPIINLDEQVNEVYTNAEAANNLDNEKENESLNIRSEGNSRNVNLDKQAIENDLPKEVTPNKPENNNNGYLEPIYSQVMEVHEDDEVAKKIQTIEDEIRACKILVDEMNSKEVTEDTSNSPYVQCEYFQIKIVKLYEQLCELTGHEPVKRREVRLRAVDSRSELPLKKLQAFINGNIKSDGLPHFPDFEEVVQCVCAANEEGGLNWDRKRITYEARALFTYCGRALQNSRQRREWRDMLTIVKSELRDPADTDPELAARLEANRHIANHRERDILEKYAAMEHCPYENPLTSNQVEMEESDDSEEDMEKEPTQLQISQVFSCNDYNENTKTPSDFNYTDKLTVVNGYNHSNVYVQHNTLNNNTSFDNNTNNISYYTHVTKSSVVPKAVLRINQPSTAVISQSNCELNINKDLADCNDSVKSSSVNSNQDLTSNLQQATNITTTICEKRPNSELHECNQLLELNKDSRNLNITCPTDTCLRVNEATSHMNNGSDLQDILEQSITNSSSGIKVLDIKIENSPDEDIKPSHGYTAGDGVEQQLSNNAYHTDAQREEIINVTQISENEHNNKEAERPKDTHNADLQIDPDQDVKVKIERTFEDVLRELNEMDDESLTATIIHIEDPFLVIEISSDSSSEDEDAMDTDEDCTKSSHNDNPQDKM